MDRLSPIRILLVEDNPDDVEIVKRALNASTVAHQLRVVYDGQEALDLLFDLGLYTGAPAPKPDVILLDLNLPKVSGFELLQKIRTSDRFPATPVVIMPARSARTTC